MIAIVGSGAICVALCAAEMSSMLPFSGGAYGYVRCSLGPTAGFLAGFSEAIKFIMTVISLVNQFGKRLVYLFDIPIHLSPVIFLVFYLIAIPVLIQGGKVFWNLCIVLAVFIVCLLLFYCTGAAAHGQFDHITTFENQGTTFMDHLCIASLFFSGFNSVTLTCSDVKNATKVMPKAYMLWVCTAFVMAFSILTAGVSMPPYSTDLINEEFPLNPGLHHLTTVSRHLCVIFTLPATFAACLGDAFTASRQIRSMAGSGLFPAYLTKSYHGSKEATPIAALLASMLVSYVALVLLFEFVSDFAEIIFEFRLYGYIGISLFLLRSYMIFRSRYSNLGRQFVSPLGLFGAFYGMAVFGAIFVSLAFFHTNFVGLIRYACFMLAAYLYYFFIAKKTEFYSKEEQQKFLKAYVVNTKTSNKKPKQVVKKSGKPKKRGMLADIVMSMVESFVPPSGGSTVVSKVKTPRASNKVGVEPPPPAVNNEPPPVVNEGVDNAVTASGEYEQPLIQVTHLDRGLSCTLDEMMDKNAQQDHGVELEGSHAGMFSNRVAPDLV